MTGGQYAVIGIHRPHDAKDYAPQEVRRLQRLLPHVQRSLEVRQKLQSANQSNRSAYFALDQLSLGVILVAATGRLLHVNTAGEAMLRAGDGLVRTPDGLRASNKEDDKLLQKLIAGLRHGGGYAPQAVTCVCNGHRAGEPTRSC